MAVTFDTSSVGGSRGVSSVTVSHVSNANTHLFVVVVDESGKTITSVTFNGTALTYYGVIDTVFKIYYLLNPATTTANVVVSLSGTMTGSQVLGVMNTSVLKNDSVTPINATSSGNYSGTSISISLTTTKPNSLILSFWNSVTSGISSPTVGGGQTAYNYKDITGSSDIISMSRKTVSAIQTETMTHGQSGGGSYNYAGAIALSVVDTPITILDTVSSPENVSVLRQRKTKITDVVTTVEDVSVDTVTKDWTNLNQNSDDNWTNLPIQ